MSELVKESPNKSPIREASEYDQDLSSCGKSLGTVSPVVALDFLPFLIGNDDNDDEGEVCCLALSANLLFTASTMSIIRAWELPLLHHHVHANVKGKKNGMGMREGKMGAVKVMKVMGEVMVISGHADCKIRIWQRCQRGADQYKLVATLPTLKDYLLNLIPPSTFLKVRRHHQCLWVEHADTISALAMARIDEESVLYSGSWDRTVKVWRMSDLRCIESFNAHDDAINAMAVSPDGLLYTGSADTKIKVWQFQKKKKKEKLHSLVATLKGAHKNRSSINALALISNGTLLYSGSSDTTIIVWGRKDNALHMIPIAVLHGHRHAVLCLALAASANNEQILCSGSADRTVRVWRCKVVGAKEGCFPHSHSHSCLAVLDGHSQIIKSICIDFTESSPATINIYSNSLHNQLKMWSICVPRQSG